MHGIASIHSCPFIIEFLESKSDSNPDSTSTTKPGIQDLKLCFFRSDASNGLEAVPPVFQVQRNAGGGDCLFLSVEQCLPSGRDHKKLRSDVVDFAMTNWWNPDIRDHLVYQHEDALEQYTAYEGVDNQLAYLYYMGTPGTFATTNELHYLALVHNFNYNYVVRNNQNPRIYDVARTCNPADPTGTTLPWYHLLFTGPQDAGHWERLIPLHCNNG